MGSKDNKPDGAELRRRAEQAAAESADQTPAKFDTLSKEETRSIIHELRVHQIELEMQNEELRRAQEELATSRARYLDLYDLAPVGYCTLSEKGLILEANLTLAGLLGKVRSELIKQPITRFILPEDQDIYYLHRKRLFETGEPQTCEMRMLNADGSALWAMLKATAEHDAAGAPGCRVVINDVSERKSLEEERIKSQHLESIGFLAGGIAHDFNNILTGVTANLSIAKMELEENRDPTESIIDALKASDRARILTRQLLTFASGGAPVKELTSIGDLITETVDFVKRGSKVKCDLVISDELSAVNVDPGQINQVINNIVINAIQAMPEGGNVLVEARNEKIKQGNTLNLPGGDFIKIAISDNGPGISPKIISQIFTPYFTTKQKGSGLGLATSYTIVKRHGGNLTVYSELGKGCSFTIYLPADKSVKVGAPKPKKSIVKGKGSILLMDDQEVIIRTTSRALIKLGYEVESAFDGAQAIEKYKARLQAGNPFDVVIMDLTVPGGMGGQETIKEMKKIDPDVKAIVASGYSEDPVLANFEEYGFMGMVAKPFRLEELSQTLASILVS